MMKMVNTKEFSGLCWSHTEVSFIKVVFLQRDLLQGPPEVLHKGLIGEGRMLYQESRLNGHQAGVVQE